MKEVLYIWNRKTLPHIPPFQKRCNISEMYQCVKTLFAQDCVTMEINQPCQWGHLQSHQVWLFIVLFIETHQNSSHNEVFLNPLENVFANIGFSLWTTFIFIHVKGRTGHQMTVIWVRMEAFSNLYLVSFPSSFPFQVLYLTHFFFPFLRNLQRSEKWSLVTKWCRNQSCPQLWKDYERKRMCVNVEVLNVLTTEVQVNSPVFLLCLRAPVSSALIGL